MDYKKEFEKLRSSLSDFRKQLDDLEKRIYEEQNCITAAHMRERVAEFNSDPKWKAFVADTERGWFGVEFQFLAIKKILEGRDYQELDFADTANGCDEVAQEAAIEVIEDKIKN